MEKRTYYVVLGIPPEETPGGVRAAWRDRARQLHPDHAGPASTQAFQELVEAYQVLSDPERRKAYNQSLREQAALPRTSPPPVQSRRFRREQTQGAPFDALQERFRRNFTRLAVPKHEGVEELNLEVLLSPEEAAAGVEVPVELPVTRPCLSCGGTGHDWLFPCLVCDQQGYLEGEETIRVPVAGGIASGTVIEVPLSGLGITNLHLRLHLFVASR